MHCKWVTDWHALNLMLVAWIWGTRICALSPRSDKISPTTPNFRGNPFLVAVHCKLFTLSTVFAPRRWRCVWSIVLDRWGRTYCAVVVPYQSESSDVVVVENCLANVSFDVIWFTGTYSALKLRILARQLIRNDQSCGIDTTNSWLHRKETSTVMGIAMLQSSVVGG